ncbi:YTH domain-containing family protein 2 [Spatholobus suberectus]|nr:YTH domain-containing family protein 2 [Spatholobus suberectus]
MAKCCTKPAALFFALSNSNPSLRSLQPCIDSFSSSSLQFLGKGIRRLRANDGRKQDLTHTSVSGSSFLNLTSPIVHQLLNLGRSFTLAKYQVMEMGALSKHQLFVKAYTTMDGDGNEQGNIIIYTDQYNKEDFPLNYRNVNFFVIKSYNEDDVHKSIKYNVWSSTPHGNKKLENAYEDVNASEQFCRVAKMVGTFDFNKNMDFCQQVKWSGSFPVKWHIIKDVPSPNFRHIILKNNENKPVTNSIDTQEVKDNRFATSSGFLKVGTIPLDAKALQSRKGDVAVKSGSQH